MTTVISLLIFFRVETSSPYLPAQQMHFMSEDILTILYESKLGDVCNQSLLNDYISQGILEGEDLNKTSLSVIGALWAAGNISEAANITKDIINGLVPSNIGYQLSINDENVYNTSDTARPSSSESTICLLNLLRYVFSLSESTRITTCRFRSGDRKGSYII